MSTNKSTSLLREMREKNGFSLEYVAGETGIKASNLSMMERGQGGISPSSAEKLVKFYNDEMLTEMQLLYPERFTEERAA